MGDITKIRIDGTDYDIRDGAIKSISYASLTASQANKDKIINELGMLKPGVYLVDFPTWVRLTIETLTSTGTRTSVIDPVVNVQEYEMVIFKWTQPMALGISGCYVLDVHHYYAPGHESKWELTGNYHSEFNCPMRWISSSWNSTHNKMDITIYKDGESIDSRINRVAHDASPISCPGFEMWFDSDIVNFMTQTCENFYDDADTGDVIVGYCPQQTNNDYTPRMGYNSDENYAYTIEEGSYILQKGDSGQLNGFIICRNGDMYSLVLDADSWDTTWTDTDEYGTEIRAWADGCTIVPIVSAKRYDILSKNRTVTDYNLQRIRLAIEHFWYNGNDFPTGDYKGTLSNGFVPDGSVYPVIITGYKANDKSGYLSIRCLFEGAVAVEPNEQGYNNYYMEGGYEYLIKFGTSAIEYIGMNSL